jgi:hypothetical protein
MAGGNKELDGLKLEIFLFSCVGIQIYSYCLHFCFSLFLNFGFTYFFWVSYLVYSNLIVVFIICRDADSLNDFIMLRL